MGLHFVQEDDFHNQSVYPFCARYDDNMNPQSIYASIGTNTEDPHDRSLPITCTHD